MSSIVLGKRADGSLLKLDVDVALRTLIQANSGGGKSWLLRRLMEQLFGKVQILAIDPEGEFATLREKYGYVLVGQGGETPADPRSARLLSEKLLELKASAVCDLFENFRGTPNGRREWVAVFLEALLDAPKKLWHPLIIIVDEAHKFCPEQMPKAADTREREIVSRCKEAMTGISTAGRKRGYCPIWATQRLAKVDKDASSEMLNRLVGMTIKDVDIDSAAELLSVSREERSDFKKEIKVLEPGDFYALGRAISKERVVVRVGSVQTKHPELGQAECATGRPPSPEKIKALLPKLADLPKEIEQKAQTDNELRAEIRALKSQLKSKKTVADSEIGKHQVGGVQAMAVRQAEAQSSSLRKLLQEAERAMVATNALVFSPVAVQPEAIAKVMESSAREIAKLANACLGKRAEDFEALKTTLSRLLARMESALRTEHSLSESEAIGRQSLGRAALAFFSGASPSSSGFGKNLSILRTRGYIDYGPDSTVLFSNDGRAFAGISSQIDTDQLFKRVSDLLSRPQARILGILREAHPNPMSRADVAEKSGQSVTSSGFEKNLSTMSSQELLVRSAPGYVRCPDWLFVD